MVLSPMRETITAMVKVMTLRPRISPVMYQQIEQAVKVTREWWDVVMADIQLQTHKVNMLGLTQIPLDSADVQLTSFHIFPFYSVVDWKASIRLAQREVRRAEERLEESSTSEVLISKMGSIF